MPRLDRACLKALSAEELSRSSRAGFLALGSSQGPGLPIPACRDSGWLWARVGTSLSDYSGGTAADFHGLSYYPRLRPSADGEVGAPRERFDCQRSRTDLTLPRGEKSVNLRIQRAHSRQMNSRIVKPLNEGGRIRRFNSARRFSRRRPVREKKPKNLLTGLGDLPRMTTDN